MTFQSHPTHGFDAGPNAPRGVAIGLALVVFGFWLPLGAFVWWWMS